MVKFALGKQPVLAGAPEVGGAWEALAEVGVGGAPATALAKPAEEPDDLTPAPETRALLRAERPATGLSRFAWSLRELTTRLWKGERCMWVAAAETSGVAMVSSESAATVRKEIEVLIVC